MVASLFLKTVYHEMLLRVSCKRAMPLGVTFLTSPRVTRIYAVIYDAQVLYHIRERSTTESLYPQ